jgi:hypothetical protein
MTRRNNGITATGQPTLNPRTLSIADGDSHDNYKEAIENNLRGMADGKKPTDDLQEEDFAWWASAQVYEDWTNFIEGMMNTDCSETD